MAKRKSAVRKKESRQLVKKESNPIFVLLNLITWLAGVLVSLAVGFGMIEETLTVKWILPIITVVAGWIVVISILLSVSLAVIHWLTKV